ncbi:MAG: GNAT family protein [Bacteroidota bacterium]
MDKTPFYPPLDDLYIQTSRLYLRPYIDEDATALFQLISSNTKRLQSSAPLTTRGNQSLAASKEFIEKRRLEAIKGQWIFLGIFLAGTDQLIGQLTIMKINTQVGKCELGYLLDGAFEGKGYMTETVKAVVTYCFEKLYFRKVSLMIGLFNQPSIKVAERCGFKPGGIMRREYQTVKGEIIDVRYFDVIPEEWGI